jgi:hypothetical protein
MKTYVFKRTIRVRQFREMGAPFESTQDSGDSRLILQERNDRLKETSSAGEVCCSMSVSDAR